MKGEPTTESLMAHPVPRKTRRPKGWLGLGTKVPRCNGCRNEPPACTCVKEEA